MLTLGQTAVESAIRDACLVDIQAFKPGNVSMASPGHGMSAADFIASAHAAAEALCRAVSSVGERILNAIEATRAVVQLNTNLGIVLLCAPLAHAVLQPSDAPGLRQRLRRVLSALDRNDAQLAYRAIRLAQPGGLGTADRHDVADVPQVALLEAMREAKQRDRIAAQYAGDYADVFETGLPIARRALQKWSSREWAAVDLYLAYLARFADSHIARKHGADTAAAVSREAAELEEVLGRASDPAQAMPRLADFDRRLKAQSINPGTSADLTVATLVAMLLDDQLERASRQQTALPVPAD